MSIPCHGMSLMLLQPPVQVEVVVLFAPQHPGQCLAVHTPFVFAQRRWSNPIVELVRLCKASRQCLIECNEGVGR